MLFFRVYFLSVLFSTNWETAHCFQLIHSTLPTGLLHEGYDYEMPKLYSLYSQISIPLLWNTPKMAFWCVFCKICWDDTCFRVLLAHTYLGIIGLPSFIFIRHGRKISSLPLKLRVQGECDTFAKFQAPWPQSITHGWYLTGPQSCCTYTSLFQESPIMWCHWTVIVRQEEFLISPKWNSPACFFLWDIFLIQQKSLSIFSKISAMYHRDKMPD